MDICINFVCCYILIYSFATEEVQGWNACPVRTFLGRWLD